MIKLFCVLFLLFNLPIFVAKANIEKVSIGETLPKNVNQLQFQLVGSAKFSVLFWDIYNSTLYTKSGSYSHETSIEPLIFEIEYLKNILADDLIDRTVEQWKHLEVRESEYKKFIPQLKAIWPDISSGDKLAMLVQNKQSIFYFNNEIVGQINEQSFSKLFLDIWLSRNTSQKILRAKLLGEIK